MYQDLKNFGALVAKANSLAKQKQDFLVPAHNLTLMSDHNHSYLNVNGKGYSMQDRAQRQLAEICSIPSTIIKCYAKTIQIYWITALIL